MNTSKQINIIVVLIFLSILATGAYWMWDPSRADRGKTEQLNSTLVRGAYLFSANCRVCHGNAGQGGAASNGLRSAPALNRPDLQGRTQAGGKVDSQAKAQAYKLVFNTITCGRVGKSMPTWGQSQGGTLNNEQIRQLATFITEGTAWDQAEEFALNGYPPSGIHGDAFVQFTLAAPIAQGDTTIKLKAASPDSLPAPQERIKVDDELMLVTAVSKLTGTLTVERGLGTTSPAAHALDATLQKPLVPPDPPPITQSACGQIPGATGPTAAPEPPSAALTIVGKGIAFDKAELRGLANTPLTVTFDNQDSGIAHNISFFAGEDATAPVIAATDIASGPVVQTLELPPLAAGSYFYQCDVHPGQMEGTLVVSEGGVAPPAPGAGETPAAEATPAP